MAATPKVPLVKVVARRDVHGRITYVEVYYRPEGSEQFHEVGVIDPCRRYPTEVTVAVPDMILAHLAVVPDTPDPALLRRAFVAGMQAEHEDRGRNPLTAPTDDEHFRRWCSVNGIPVSEVTT